MRKILLLAISVIALSLFSCEKEEIGGTATQSLAGQWYITIDAVDSAGNVMTDATGSTADYENYFSFSNRLLILTYNTAANNPNEMYLDMSPILDDDNAVICPFVGFKVLIPCNTGSSTFGGDTVLSMIVYDLDYTTSDTLIDTVQVKLKKVSCLADTSVIDYDTTYVTRDTVYKVQDTTFIKFDTLYIGVDTVYNDIKIDTVLTPAVPVIDTIYYDSIGVFYAYQRIDTIISATTPVYDKVKVWNGKITKDGAVTPSGMKADAIEFEFYTDGDDIGYYFDDAYELENAPGDLRMGVPFTIFDGFDHYKVSGFRYTGFEADE